jgi:hypothetical protein
MVFGITALPMHTLEALAASSEAISGATYKQHVLRLEKGDTMEERAGANRSNRIPK